jgi:hypothetical protein
MGEMRSLSVHAHSLPGALLAVGRGVPGERHGGVSIGARSSPLVIGAQSRPLHYVRLPLLKAGVAERSGATEGLSSGSRLDADRGQCVAPIRTARVSRGA